MTQFQHTLKQLLMGQKTETSRLALPEPNGTGEYDCEMITFPMGTMAVSLLKKNARNWSHKWVVGKDYAIQPSRTAKSIGRFRVLNIWRQDVRTLTAEQAEAEGFESRLAFLSCWIKMHDPRIYNQWQGVLLRVDNRPNEYYSAWRMSITVLWDTINWDAPAVAALQITPHRIH